MRLTVTRLTHSALGVQTGPAGVCQGYQWTNTGLHSGQVASLSRGYNERQTTVHTRGNTYRQFLVPRWSHLL